MPELLVQKYLRGPAAFSVDSAHVRLLELASEPYHLNVKRHPEFNNLVQFSYDQIDSPRDNKLVQQCRGLILDQDRDWAVVAYPFDRFFNFGESMAAEIDWKNAWVQEKIDGSLMIFYFHAGRWNVATKGSPDAGGTVGDNTTFENGERVPMTFQRLFWSSCEYWLKGLSKSGQFDENNTYLFELTSPWNRVVCDYTKVGPMGDCVDGNGESHYFPDLIDRTGYASDGSRITLIGIRNNVTFQEIPAEFYRGDVHYVVQQYPLDSYDAVIAAAMALNPLRQEGFVVVDGNWRRVKIKSPAYVAIHHLRDGSPRRRLMDLIKAGEESELMAYKVLDDFPAEKALFLAMQEKIERFILQAETIYANIKGIENQKDFALEALKSPFSAALFAVRKGQTTSIRQFVLGMASDKLLDLVDKDTNET